MGGRGLLAGTMIGLLWAAIALGQSPQATAPQAAAPAAGPDQPVNPNLPQFQERAPQQPPQAPFVLSPAEDAQLDRVLNLWQQSSDQVKTFSCNFTRYDYNKAFPQADGSPTLVVDKGAIRYSKPDKGSFVVEGDRPEQWICNGQSIFEYDFTKKQVIEHQLPPELQGKAIADGPLPFLFGASAAKLRQRYFLRILPQQQNQNREILLQAYPRFQQDAANFDHAELILTLPDMQPFAMQLHLPGGKQWQSYRFEKVSINGLWDAMTNPFSARVPLGWQKVLDAAPQAQANRGQPNAAPR